MNGPAKLPNPPAMTPLALSPTRLWPAEYGHAPPAQHSRKDGTCQGLSVQRATLLEAAGALPLESQCTKGQVRQVRYKSWTAMLLAHERQYAHTSSLGGHACWASRLHAYAF